MSYTPPDQGLQEIGRYPFGNPKHEIRNPKQAQNPKSEARNGDTPVSDFGFRISDLFRISRFGFRIWITLNFEFLDFPAKQARRPLVDLPKSRDSWTIVSIR